MTRELATTYAVLLLISWAGLLGYFLRAISPPSDPRIASLREEEARER